MALKPDDTVCFCFHVPLRKIENFCKVEKPKAASQISQCLSAGSGCGWWVPMLRKIHGRLCGEYKPWWKKMDAEENYHSAERDASDTQVDPQEYAGARQQSLNATGRKPPVQDGLNERS